MKSPQKFTDQLGRTLNLVAPAKKIISLVPSQTEFLHALGLDHEVLGITKFCVHPHHWKSEKTLVGGTKNPDIECIKRLQPDLVIANKEENREEDIEIISTFCPVWVSDVIDVKSACDMMLRIGEMTGAIPEALEIVTKTEIEFSSLSTRPKLNLRTAYLIWWKPLMLAGAQTFIAEMMHSCGMCNIADSGGERYPSIDIEQLGAMQPELILLSSEPFSFKEKHREMLSTAIPGALILTVDGEMFSWYGSRMVESPKYLHELMDQIQHISKI